MLILIQEMRNDDHTLFERGKGNVCSVEFNCLYRWHATTSREDEKYTEQVFSSLFPGKAPADVTAMDFKMAAYKIQMEQKEPTHWTFGGYVSDCFFIERLSSCALHSLKRQEDGSFSDADLSNIIHNATEHSAAAFGARGTPRKLSHRRTSCAWC